MFIEKDGIRLWVDDNDKRAYRRLRAYERFRPITYRFFAAIGVLHLALLSIVGTEAWTLKHLLAPMPGCVMIWIIDKLLGRFRRRRVAKLQDEGRIKELPVSFEEDFHRVTGYRMEPDDTNFMMRHFASQLPEFFKWQKQYDDATTSDQQFKVATAATSSFAGVMNAIYRRQPGAGPTARR